MASCPIIDRFISVQHLLFPTHIKHHPILYFRGLKFKRQQLDRNFRNVYDLRHINGSSMQDLAPGYDIVVNHNDPYIVAQVKFCIAHNDNILFPFWNFDILRQLQREFPDMDHRCIHLGAIDDTADDSEFTSVGVAIPKRLQDAS